METSQKQSGMILKDKLWGVLDAATKTSDTEFQVSTVIKYFCMSTPVYIFYVIFNCYQELQKLQILHI